MSRIFYITSQTTRPTGSSGRQQTTVLKGRRILTYAHRLTAFEVGPDGSLTDRRPFAEIEGCYPDGICLDAEGAVWVADPRGNEPLRIVEGGRIDRRISTGAQGTFACMLGGGRRRTLFVCTNTDSGPETAQRKEGRIETIRVAVTGAGLP